MKRKLHSKWLILLLAIFSVSQLNAQMVDDHAYMIGDHVIIGVSENGHEGAPCLDTVICTAPPSGLIGMVANPAMDDWVTINGDFFAMGSPESGFGLEYTVLGETYQRSNNAVGLNEIDGEITSFYETADSIVVTWVGETGVDELELTITYTLQKDQHYYTTSMVIDNLGTETYTDVYYYRNLDPDNNQSSGASFSTDNTIVSQSEMANDSVIVQASQPAPWDSHVIFHAYGADWKGFYGGFANRDGSAMWNAEGALVGTEGATMSADLACGVAYKIETLPPGKAMSDVFSFATAFVVDVEFEDEEPATDGIDENTLVYELYPNPTNGGFVNLNMAGAYTFNIVDLKGSIVLTGQGSELTQIELSNIEKGIYFINIQQNNVQTTEKIVLQ